MSVVIIGGHERMVRQYEEICEKHGCDAKVFVAQDGQERCERGQKKQDPDRQSTQQQRFSTDKSAPGARCDAGKLRSTRNILMCPWMHPDTQSTY